MILELLNNHIVRITLDTKKQEVKFVGKEDQVIRISLRELLNTVNVAVGHAYTELEKVPLEKDPPPYVRRVDPEEDGITTQ